MRPHESLLVKRGSEMPSSRPLSNKEVVPNADFMLLPATTLALEPGEGRAGVTGLADSSSGTR